MYGINRLSIVGWSLVLVGILLILGQSSRGWPDWLFTLGLTLMVAGSVLRVYGKFSRGKK